MVSGFSGALAIGTGIYALAFLTAHALPAKQSEPKLGEPPLLASSPTPTPSHVFGPLLGPLPLILTCS